MRFTKLFDGEHLEANVSENDKVSSVMGFVGVDGQGFGDMCHEVAT